ncbi:MAG: hypothetical protein KatS3mg118_2821 [Paracoccaceae bacterium]|nr:MAG: sulfotransferase [Alphaproteobacteria bacterium]GIX14862.1 MAG: hypothetical protein KatS3mg118_2821 [Paracoccaceae bacterium]
MLPPGLTLMFGIGAQKAGTTWLYDYLSAHPDCHLPAEKEVHYFDVMRLPSERGHLERRLARVRQLAANLPAEPGPGLAVASRRLRRALDLIEVYSGDGRHHDRYVDHLLAGLEDQRIVGDITPSYAVLDRDGFAEMAALAPDVRFIFIMRDPVDRMWSAIRTQADAPGLSEAEFRARAIGIVDRFLREGRTRRSPRSDYVRTITELEAAVPRERILYLFYEDLFRVDSIEELCRFLGIAPRPADFQRRSNPGRIFALDADRVIGLRDALMGQYEFVAERFGAALPAIWQSRMTEAGRAEAGA